MQTKFRNNFQQTEYQPIQEISVVEVIAKKKQPLNAHKTKPKHGFFLGLKDRKSGDEIISGKYCDDKTC